MEISIDRSMMDFSELYYEPSILQQKATSQLAIVYHIAYPTSNCHDQHFVTK